MGVEQVISVAAAALCIVSAVVAVTHRDPRAAGAALMVMLLALAALYAGLAAPTLAAVAIAVALFVTLPLVVHLTVPAARASLGGGPLVAGAAVLLAAAILGILAVSIALGEVPVNLADRSSDGYDLAALGALLTGRSVVAVGGSVVVLVAAAVSARAARRERRPGR